MNTLQRLYTEQGQSPWIDFIDRALIDSGKLEELRREGLRGQTSNPTIFAKAVASGQYDDLVRRMIDEGADSWTIYEQIAVDTCGRAADVLRPVYDQSPGSGDGCVSIEVEPQFAHDTGRTLERVRHLWGRLNRPNVFVKIPATPEGLPAIEQAISEGININVTLMFSVDVYRSVAQAYIAGLQRRADAEAESRQRGLGGELLRESRRHEDRQGARCRDCPGAHASWEGGDSQREARVRGISRDLWRTRVRRAGSGGGAGATLSLGFDLRQESRVPRRHVRGGADRARHREHDAARHDRGVPGPWPVERTLDRDLEDAHRIIEEVEAQGIAMSAVTRELLAEGVEAFAKSFDELIGAIESKRRAFAHA